MTSHDSTSHHQQQPDTTRPTNAHPTDDPDDTGPDGRVNLSWVAELVRSQRVAAEVQCTGGNTWTLYAGGSRYRHDGVTGAHRRDAKLGPAALTEVSPGEVVLCGYLDELAVGPDDSDVTSAVGVHWCGARTARDIAALVAAQATRADPSDPLERAEIEAALYEVGRRPDGTAGRGPLGEKARALLARRWLAALNTTLGPWDTQHDPADVMHAIAVADHDGSLAAVITARDVAAFLAPFLADTATTAPDRRSGTAR